MAIYEIGKGVPKYIGVSTDTKPTAASPQSMREPQIGSTFLEEDTSTLWITYDRTNWALKDAIGEVQTTPTSNTLLSRVKALLTGTILAAGTAIIGKILPARTVVETQFTGTGAVAVGTHKLAPGVAYKVVAIEFHNCAAPTTGTQNFILTLDNGTGSAYDLTLLSIDCVANAVTDLRVTPQELLCKSSDVVTAALVNSDAVTWGLCFKHEVTG